MQSVFYASMPDGRLYESFDGHVWKVIQIRGPWRADECAAFGAHTPDHDGLCAVCCGRDEAGE